ncbi:Polysaccharide pyruvyl transferase [Bifidobacterium longum]|uniref:Polysaccharide pyruvyl transferase n=1 Tax=Bifidobacterium longum TaxID=216816 RepID=A0A2N0TF24_BIFLN|nr:polysaccharide pyruvyl transferase family protein [Bifidobacterium longum]PKD13318.1 Polysaccharide pyruvyl transferase [Bifidobacterium longum]
MGFKRMITYAVKDILGDAKFELIRHNDLAQEGLKKYGKLFEDTAESPRNILTCCPHHGNLGDHAIALAERRVLRRGQRPLLSFDGDTTSLLLCLQRYSSMEDTIYLHGGGNMGTLYRNEEEYRLYLISAMRKNRIILFPQTMSFGDTEDDHRFLRHTQHVYGAHPDLHLFAREQVTYERMKAAYPDNDVQLVPDIVLSVSGEDNADFTTRQGILLCMRNDVERSMGNDSHQRLEGLARDLGMDCRYTDTTVPAQDPISQEEGERLVHRKWDEFRSARLVITDRLHGMIFSAVTGTPCVALNNSNGKVGFEYEWLKDVPYVMFASTVDEVPELARQVLQVMNPQFPSDWFASQFAPLLAMIK